MGFTGVWETQKMKDGCNMTDSSGKHSNTLMLSGVNINTSKQDNFVHFEGEYYPFASH